jgi:UDP-glucose-4-epimerase GalE
VTEFGPIPFIFSSTCATYGPPDRLPISEDHPQRPINPYGYSKLVVERILADLEVSHRLRWVTLRYFNAAGCDPDGEIGEVHNPETHLIPLVLQAARDGTPIHIFGTDYDTPDGTCIRDYVHVMDIADAHVRAMDFLFDGGPSGAFNLANATGYSVKQVIDAAEGICGRKIHIKAVARRAGDPPALVGSSARARTTFGWSPTRSELRYVAALRRMPKPSAVEKREPPNSSTPNRHHARDGTDDILDSGT